MLVWYILLHDFSLRSNMKSYYLNVLVKRTHLYGLPLVDAHAEEPFQSEVYRLLNANRVTIVDAFHNLLFMIFVSAIQVS